MRDGQFLQFKDFFTVTNKQTNITSSFKEKKQQLQDQAYFTVTITKDSGGKWIMTGLWNKSQTYGEDSMPECNTITLVNNTQSEKLALWKQH